MKSINKIFIALLLAPLLFFSAAGFASAVEQDAENFSECIGKFDEARCRDAFDAIKYAKQYSETVDNNTPAIIPNKPSYGSAMYAWITAKYPNPDYQSSGGTTGGKPTCDSSENYISNGYPERNCSGSSLSQGARCSRVCALQKALLDQGFLLGPGDVDGQYGQHTQDAVSSFQGEKKITGDPDGVAGPNTLAALGLAAAPSGGGSTPANPSGGAPSGGQGKCPDGFEALHGLCVPNTGFKTGIAGSKSLADLIVNVLKFMLAFAGAVAVVSIVIGGFIYLTAAGNEEAGEKSRKVLTAAIIGLIIVLLAYSIVAIISNVLTTDVN